MRQTFTLRAPRRQQTVEVSLDEGHPQEQLAAIIEAVTTRALELHGEPPPRRATKAQVDILMGWLAFGSADSTRAQERAVLRAAFRAQPSAQLGPTPSPVEALRAWQQGLARSSLEPVALALVEAVQLVHGAAGMPAGPRLKSLGLPLKFRVYAARYFPAGARRERARLVLVDLALAPTRKLLDRCENYLPKRVEISP